MDEHHRKPLGVGHSIGGYGIVREIGRGGFGIVYEALNPVTQDRVAVKQFYPQAIASWLEGTIVIKRSDDEELVRRILKRFEDEAKLQFDFDHPNILKVKNFIRADNTGYLISEYIDGSSLTDFLKQYDDAFPDEDMFRRTMEPVVDALGYVHGRKVLHRDISPDNILIEKSGRPVLVDFGAAKLDLLRNPSASSIVPFREAYAPVEQQVPAKERPEGYYTDIYALAGTMYRAIAGKPPVRAIERKLASKDPYIPLVEAARIKCSSAVCAAIDRGLALATANRPQSIWDYKQMLGWRPGPPRPSGPPKDVAPNVVIPPGVIVRSAEPGAGIGSVAAVEGTVSGQKRSRWKAYGFVALVVAGVAGGLFLTPSLDTQPATKPSTRTLETQPAAKPSTPTLDTQRTTKSSTPTPAPLQTKPPRAPTPAAAPPPVQPSAPARSQAPSEAELFDNAIICLRKAAPSSCDIDHCVAQYRHDVGYENRYPELRSEYFKLTARCSAPTPTPTPLQTKPPSAPTPAAAPPPVQPSAPARPQAPSEAELFDNAIICLRKAAPSSCDIDHCVAQYRHDVGYENRYPELRSEYFKLTARCSAPTPTPAPPPTGPPSASTPTPVPPQTLATPSPSPTIPSILLLPGTTRPAPSPPPPAYIVFENHDIDGGDLPIPFLRGVNQSACESACNDDARCVGYSYGKWDRACYLKGSLPNLRFEPNSTAVIRSNQQRPPDAAGARKIETAKRVFTGNLYSTINTGSRPSCAEACQRDETCLGYQYVAPACSRYDRIDFATKDETAQSGVKRQPAP